MAGRQTQLRSEPVKKYIWEIGLERPKKIVPLLDWMIHRGYQEGLTTICLEIFRKLWTNMECFPVSCCLHQSLLLLLCYYTAKRNKKYHKYCCKHLRNLFLTRQEKKKGGVYRGEDTWKQKRIQTTTAAHFFDSEGLFGLIRTQTLEFLLF